MAIMLCTSGRREDAVRLGPRHIRDGRLQFTQAKNEHRQPVEIDIPIHPELLTAIEATASRQSTFLVTDYGRPFTPNGFGNKVKEWCRQAGLPHCSCHGLRKAAATRLAEGGATPHEIMAITGHRSLEEVERYTRAAIKRSSPTPQCQSSKDEHLSVPLSLKWDT
jgi:integrase/recombinase XerD